MKVTIKSHVQGSSICSARGQLGGRVMLGGRVTLGELPDDFRRSLPVPRPPPPHRSLATVAVQEENTVGDKQPAPLIRSPGGWRERIPRLSEGCSVSARDAPTQTRGNARTEML